MSNLVRKATMVIRSEERHQHRDIKFTLPQILLVEPEIKLTEQEFHERKIPLPKLCEPEHNLMVPDPLLPMYGTQNSFPILVKRHQSPLTS